MRGAYYLLSPDMVSAGWAVRRGAEERTESLTNEGAPNFAQLCGIVLEVARGDEVDLELGGDAVARGVDGHGAEEEWWW